MKCLVKHGWVLACLLGTAAVDAADLFKQLDAAGIRGKVVGRTVTDESHWSDRFLADGRFDAMELGVRKQGAWRIQGGEMCVTRKTRKPVEECFEIWLSNNNKVEYRRDGVTLTTALLRDE